MKKIFMIMAAAMMLGNCQQKKVSEQQDLLNAYQKLAGLLEEADEILFKILEI